MAKRQAHKTEVKRTWETSNGDRIHVELLDGRTGSGWKNPRRAIKDAESKDIPQFYFSEGPYYARISAIDRETALEVYKLKNPRRVHGATIYCSE